MKRKNKEEVSKQLTIEIPKLKSEVFDELNDAEKTKIFDYKMFEKNFKTEEEIINTSKKEYKRKIFKYLIPISIFSILFISIILQSNISYSYKLNQYEEDTMSYDKNIDATVKIYSEGNLSDNNTNNAADNLISCINSKIDVNNIPTNVQNVIDKINDFYNESSNHFAFAYKDLHTGFTVTYNESQQVFTASTIKAPTDLYIYEMASLGKINLDDEMTYTSNYFNPKSGKLKYNDFNTKYTVRELL